jgi:hypothetical protein
MLGSMSLAEEYEERRGIAAEQYVRGELWRSRYATTLLALMGVVLWLMVGVVHRNESLWPVGAVVLLAVAVLVLMTGARQRSTAASRRSEFYKRALGRLSGEQSQTGFIGDVFAEESHLYERDLNVLGPDSLFGMLATTRTALGQRALAGMLLHPAAAAAANARQEAVKELAPLLELREQVGLLGRWGFEDLPAESFESWLDAEQSNFPRWPRVVLLVLTASWIVALAVGLFLHIDTPLLLRNVAALLAVQAAVCFPLRAKVQGEIDAAKSLSSETGILREGIRILRESKFQAKRLVELQREVEGEDRALAQLQRPLIVVEQRTKEWYYALGLLFCAGTHAAIALDAWKRQHAEPMRRWLTAWAEFEVLLAVGTYAAEREQNVYPEVVESDGHTALFAAEGMVHPLLPRDKAVANDVILGDGMQFLLISGSNMAGKSTLLRAIGTNAVLASLGAPVTARSMRLCAVKIGASITISDSLAEGKSKFLAEVERLKALVTLARENPGQMLFLIDEVLSGTNSLDRKAAAESVLRSLVLAGGIGAISTHDLTLASLANIAELHGRNVHMASADEDDPLGFDYLLKDGMNRTTNAMAIVRMLGLG